MRLFSWLRKSSISSRKRARGNRQGRQRRLCPPLRLEARLALAAGVFPTAVDDYIAVEPISTTHLFPLGNDSVEQPDSARVRLMQPPSYGSAAESLDGKSITYTPRAGFQGHDELTYVLQDDSGSTASASIKIQVGRSTPGYSLVADSGPVRDAAASSDWITRLESGSGDIEIPDGGITIDRPVTVSRATRILGRGQTLRLAGAGRIIVQLSSAATFELRDAHVVWEPTSNDPQATAAIQIHRGTIKIADNSFFANVALADAAYQDVIRLESLPPESYLIRIVRPMPSNRSALSSNSGIGLDIRDNLFTSAYWYSVGLLNTTPDILPGAQLTGNDIRFFHYPFKLEGLGDAAITDNQFEQNTGHNVFLAASNGTTISRNQIRFAGGNSGNDAIRLQDLSNVVVNENVIYDPAGSGIRLTGQVHHTTVARNFIHGAKATALAIGRDGSRDAFSGIVVEENFLAQNLDWAITAINVGSLVLRENVLHQNRTEYGLQHHFENVQEVVDEQNLWDVDFRADDVGYPSYFGTNARTYRFPGGMEFSEPESITTPLDMDAVQRLRPSGDNLADESWISELESGSGDIVVPSSGITINRPVVLTKPRRILGEGRTIRFTGEGGLTIRMEQPGGSFELRDANVLWEYNTGTSGRRSAITLLNGGFKFSKNRVFVLVEQPEAFYDDPVRGTAVTRRDLGQNPALTSFFEFSPDPQSPSPLELVGNTFENARWYAAALMDSADNARFSHTVIRDNTVKYFHGALYLYGIDGGIVEGNRLYRNSFGNLVIVNAANVIARNNRLEFPGNGTSGDGATLRSIRGLTFENNWILNGSCYGIWMLEDVTDSRFEGNVIHGGITSAIRIEAVNEGNSFERLAINRNFLTHNNSWGLSGISAKVLNVSSNVFEGNYADEWGLQHRFWDFHHVDTSDNQSMATVDTAELVAAFGVSAVPYWMLDEGTEITSDNDSWVFNGRPEDDLFQIVVDSNIHVQMNGDWRSTSASATPTVRLQGNAGYDSTIISVNEAVSSVTLEPGRSYLHGPDLMIDTESESHSVYGHAGATALFRDSPNDDQFYVSSGYQRMYGAGFDNYAQGFGTSWADSRFGADYVAVDDSPSDDVFHGNSSVNCLLGSDVHHATRDFATVAVRSDAGGSDSAILYPRPGDLVQQSSDAARLVSEFTYLTIDRFEDYEVDAVQSATSTPDACMRFASKSVPTGEIRGAVWNDVDGDELRTGTELGLGGQVVFLDTDGNQQLDPGELWTNTEATGEFHFGNLAAGNYTVVHRLPDLWYGPDAVQSVFVSPGESIFGLDFSVREVIRIQDHVVDVFGTSRDDVFEFQAAAVPYRLLVNGFEYAIEESTASLVKVWGGGGSDQIQLVGSAFDDSLVVHPGEVEFVVPGLRLQAAQIEEVEASAGGGGADLAVLFDSAGDDRLTANPGQADLAGPDYRVSIDEFARIFVHQTSGGQNEAVLTGSQDNDELIATPEFVRLAGDSFYLYVEGAESTTVDSAAGKDRAYLYDSSGDETFIGRPSSAHMDGDGFEYRAENFEDVYSYATAGGDDHAVLHGSDGDDDLVATPSVSRLIGSGYYQYVQGFELVETSAGSGGMDEASLFDSPGDDVFVGSTKSGELSGSGYVNRASGFDTIYAYSRAGGSDRAELNDSPSDDELLSTPEFTVLSSQDSYHYLERFSAVTIESSAGGEDRAYLFDSLGDDEFLASPRSSRMTGDGFDNRTHGFFATYAFATAGGNDRAILYDSPGNDNLVFTSGLARVYEDTEFYNYASGFERYVIIAGQGNDLAEIRNIGSADTIEGERSRLSFERGTTLNQLEGFDRIVAHADAGNLDSVHLNNVDYLFEQVGDWL